MAISQRTTSGRLVLCWVWGLLSFAGVGALITTLILGGPAVWVGLALFALQILFLLMSIAYSIGREDQHCQLVEDKITW